MADCSVAPDSAAGLLERMRQCRVLSPAQLKELSAGSLPPDPKAMARSLIQSGLLTHYQANLLFQGRGAELLLEPYVVLARLGEGGAGLVLKARHPIMNRIVAIKLIRKDLLKDPDVVARFHREIEVASQVSHPNVVHAYDAGPLGGTFGLVMEYVEGTDLARLIKDEGPLSPSRACDYIRQAALGMQHVHERGLIHRDLKPSNLLVATPKEGEGNAVVKVLDLGLARLSGQKAQTASSQLTTMGSVMMGTPDYMAPEQALDLRAADIRADVYSLGCTLFFLLTGQPPYPAGSLAQKLMKHQMAPIPSVCQLRAELPAALDPVLRKMLAKQPDERYQTPAEVANALAPLAAAGRRTGIRKAPANTWSGNESVTLLNQQALPPLTRPAETTLPRQRRRRWPLPLGAAALFLTGVIAIWALASSGSKSNATGSQAGLSSTDPQQARVTGSPLSTTLDTLTVLGDPRGRYWGNVASMVFSPSSKLLACTGHSGPTVVWDAASLTELCSIPYPSRNVNCMALSPDGKHLLTCIQALTGISTEFKVWDVSSGKEVRSWSHPGSVANSVAYTGDADTVVSSHQRNTPGRAGSIFEVRTWEASSGKEKRPVIEMPGTHGGRLSANGATALTYSPTGWKAWELPKGTSEAEGANQQGRGMPLHTLSADGQTLLMASQKPAMVNNNIVNELQLIDLSPQKPGAVVNRVLTANVEEEYSLNYIAAGPRPRTIILWGHHIRGTGGPALRLWDAAATPPKLLAQVSTSNTFNSLTTSPDGTNLAAGSYDGNIRLYDALSLTERLPDTAHRGYLNHLAFADNDQVVVSASLTDRTVRAWDHARGKERSRLSIPPTEKGWFPNLGLSFAWPADGSGVAVNSNQALRWLDPIASKQRDLALPGENQNVHGMAVSGDGKTVGAMVNGVPKLWDTASGQARACAITTPLPLSGTMFLSQDGKTLVGATIKTEAGKSAYHYRLIDPATGADRLVVPTPFTGLNAPAFSVDGHYLAVFGSAFDGKKHTQEWKAWDLTTGKERVLVPAGGIHVHCNAVFAPTGSNLALWQSNRLEVWDIAAEKSRFNLTLQPQPGRSFGIRGVAFSRDGQRIVCAHNDGRLVLHDCANGATVHEWKLPGGPNSIAVSRDGRQVAAGSPGGLIHVCRMPGIPLRSEQ